MWRNILRVSVGLCIAHGLLTFGAGISFFRADTVNMLAFVQHGFTFIFIALLNLVAWRQPRPPRWQCAVVHGCNLAFLAFGVVFTVFKPEPPLITSVVILLFLTIAAVGTDVSATRA
ncbi:MAG: hypothetical protein ABJE47_10820 [bacterium]